MTDQAPMSYIYISGTAVNFFSRVEFISSTVEQSGQPPGLESKFSLTSHSMRYWSNSDPPSRAGACISRRSFFPERGTTSTLKGAVGGCDLVSSDPGKGMHHLVL
eukprot:snap_masked-scaffold_17-processed-gene-3.17-mRNA-1 protein AED:1.00 eAED:1.00 QI:0/-1/0/0/-1/1/1/0/104